MTNDLRLFSSKMSNVALPLNFKDLGKRYRIVSITLS